MEKTITIDGKQVRFRSSGATPLRYKAQFGGKDFFHDLLKMHKLTKIKDKENPDYEDLKLIDFDFFYNIIWVLAKTGDKTIPDHMEWLDTFDTFPVMEIIDELNELILSTLQSKKK